MKMTFFEYQIRTEDTANYPGSGGGKIDALSYVGLGLGEAGEVQGKIKKILRDDDGIVTQEKREEIGKEIGDVLWYLARLAEELNYELGDLAQQNLEKLESRKKRGVIAGSGDNR